MCQNDQRKFVKLAHKCIYSNWMSYTKRTQYLNAETSFKSLLGFFDRFFSKVGPTFRLINAECEVF